MLELQLKVNNWNENDRLEIKMVILQSKWYNWTYNDVIIEIRITLYRMEHMEWTSLRAECSKCLEDDRKSFKTWLEWKQLHWNWNYEIKIIMIEYKFDHVIIKTIWLKLKGT